MPKEEKPVYTNHFNELSIPLRLAITFGMGVLAFVAIASNVQYFRTIQSANQAKNNPSQNNQQPNQQETTPQPNTPSINQPQQGSGSGSGSGGISCNTSQRTVLTNQYNNQIASENSRHQSVLNFLTATGASSSAFDSENNTHNANLSSINTQYQSNLRSIGC